ncbi:hypothetical protein CAEBREN_06817 [Caenorhabditis brenneri]|uniref:Uncharacterized protein n=1 Tax=Caenorhabditis brenneri TaxID=135651 RepID=G0NQI9_CAEBE|nr:hypothetical protein CAEBREN_06817 [Caenorhabditis brenneri]
MPTEQANPMSDPEIRKQVEERIRQLEIQQLIRQNVAEKPSRTSAQLREEQLRRILCKGMGFKHTFRNPYNQWKAPTEEDLEARRQIVTEVMNLQLQAHDLAARLALRTKMIETEALPVLERMEAFGRMAQAYADLNSKALENYRVAIDGVLKAAWEDLTKMAEEAPSRRAKLEGIIRHLQGGQGAASEAEKL